MSEIEAALVAGVLAQIPVPLGILFFARYAIKGWNSRAVAIHLEHDARVVGSKLLRRPPTTAPTEFRARGKTTI